MLELRKHRAFFDGRLARTEDGRRSAGPADRRFRVGPLSSDCWPVLELVLGPILAWERIWSGKHVHLLRLHLLVICGVYTPTVFSYLWWKHSAGTFTLLTHTHHLKNHNETSDDSRLFPPTNRPDEFVVRAGKLWTFMSFISDGKSIIVIPREKIYKATVVRWMCEVQTMLSDHRAADRSSFFMFHSPPDNNHLDYQT